MESASNADQRDDNSDLCPICYDREVIQGTRCGHRFCSVCFNEWFVMRDMRTCPMCRNDDPVIEEDEVEEFIATFTESHERTIQNTAGVKGQVIPITATEAREIEGKIGRNIDRDTTNPRSLVVGYDYAVIDLSDLYIMGHLERRTIEDITLTKCICMQRDGAIYPCKPSTRKINVSQDMLCYRIV